VAWKQVDDAETAIKQEQKVMSNAEKAGLTTRKPDKTFDKVLNAIRDSLSVLASSDDEEDGVDKEDDEDNTALEKLSTDDKCGWVIGTISNWIQHRMGNFR